MLNTATKTHTKPTTTTAENALMEKTRDTNVISGGHLVAKALMNEGVDTIFTLCGGHIFDIYEGCVDEGIRIIEARNEKVAAHAPDREISRSRGHHVEHEGVAPSRASF